MRHEIGVEQILFGRDYPHLEGTWPHTADWLRIAFDGVPRARRPAHARRERRPVPRPRPRTAAPRSPSGSDPRSTRSSTAATEIRPELLENFANRGGFLKPAEGADRLPLVDSMFREDLAKAAAQA